MTRGQIRDLLNSLYLQYRPYLDNLTPEERRIITDTWADAFRDVAETDLREAISAYRKEKRYFPDVSELRPYLPKRKAETPAASTAAEVAEAFRQNLWALEGHKGLAPAGWEPQRTDWTPEEIYRQALQVMGTRGVQGPPPTDRSRRTEEGVA